MKLSKEESVRLTEEFGTRLRISLFMVSTLEFQTRREMLFTLVERLMESLRINYKENIVLTRGISAILMADMAIYRMIIEDRSDSVKILNEVLEQTITNIANIKHNSLSEQLEDLTKLLHNPPETDDMQAVYDFFLNSATRFCMVTVELIKADYLMRKISKEN